MRIGNGIGAHTARTELACVTVEKILTQLFRAPFGAHSGSNSETEWWRYADAARPFAASWRDYLGDRCDRLDQQGPWMGLRCSSLSMWSDADETLPPFPVA